MSLEIIPDSYTIVPGDLVAFDEDCDMLNLEFPHKARLSPHVASVHELYIVIGVVGQSGSSVYCLLLSSKNVMGWCRMKHLLKRGCAT